MSSSAVYVGIDISSEHLDLCAPSIAGKRFANTRTGRAALVRLLVKVGPVHVVCEATGGYERDLADALHAEDIPVSIMNPRQVRDFARAKGRLATGSYARLLGRAENSEWDSRLSASGLQSLTRMSRHSATHSS